MLRLELEPLHGSGSEFQLQLEAPRTKSRAVVSIDRHSMQVRDDSPGAGWILAERPLRPELRRGAPVLVNVVATGNRLVINCGRQMLRCDQPAGQSGEPLEFSLVSPRGGFAIREMRIEGE